MGDKEIWQNWEEVTAYTQPCLRGRRLFRSSAPNYDGHNDSSQDLSQAAVDILVKRGINRIVSFNHVHYNSDEMNRLAKAKILYRHRPVEDFKAATLEDLRLTIAFVRDGPPANTLIHCGFGWGRTGVGVTAVQLFATWGGGPPEQDWKSVNHVEEDPGVQGDRLRELKAIYKKGA